MTLKVIIIIIIKQVIRLPVSRSHTAGSSLELIEVTCFLKLNADQVLVFDRIARSCQVTCKHGRVVRKPVNANEGL